MTIIEMNMTKTLFLAVILLLLGRWVRSKVSFLVKFSIPDAVVGGLLFAIATLALRKLEIVGFEFDTTLQTFFMQVFFTAAGFEASGSLIKNASGKLLIFIVLAAVLAFLQNVLAVGLSNVLGVDPLLGLMTGSTPLTGGHGNAASFGPIAVEMGQPLALDVAVAAATFGLVIGSLVGGPFATRLIEKNNLLAKDSRSTTEYDELEEVVEMPVLNGRRFSRGTFLVLIALGLGAYLADVFKVLLPNVTLPIHVMGMIGGAFVRNVYDAMNKNKAVNDRTPTPEIEIISDISLGLFVSMAIMTMKLWELLELAGPLLILLFAQVILIVTFVWLFTFRLMGKDYDAAVITAGHIGFGLGAVPVSMANMNTLCGKYRYSKIAFIIVPVVGGMFSNFTNAAIITGFLNFFG